MKWRLLVIGYGNELRRDDAVGPQTARAASRLKIPGLKAIAVQQLTPELAAMMAEAERVVFVDAGHGDDDVRTRPVQPSNTVSCLGHMCDPRVLLGLTEALYSRRPRAWMLTAPAPDLDCGEGLSVVAQRGVAAALQEISRLAGDAPAITETQAGP